MDLKVVLEKIEIFSCKICKRAYRNIIVYLTHILTHVEKVYVKLEKQKIYGCKSCNAGFLNRDDFKLHQIYHIMQNVKKKHMRISSNRKHYINNNIVRNFECTECGRKFAHQDTLKEHSQVHEPYSYTCACGIGYHSQIDFNMHLSLVHKETKTTTDKTAQAKTSERKVIYKDDLEDDVFDDEASEKLEDHFDDYDYGKNARKTTKPKKTNMKKPKLKIKLKTNHTIKYEPDDTKKMVECRICEKQVRSSNLNRHMNAKHLGKYSCTICKRSFNKKEVYERHMLAHESYKCTFCGKQFKNRYAKQLHERVHTGQRPLSCKFCSKPFSDPSALLRHHRTHTKEYRYFCNLCPQKYTDKSALISHNERIHKKSKKQFNCDICNKLFANKYYLEKHLKLHIGKKEFECHTCKKKFAHKSYLFIHITNKSCMRENNFNSTKCKKDGKGLSMR